MVMGRGHGRCEACGVREATDFHHRQRRRDGGHSVENGLACCRQCHGMIHAHPELARSHGWIVSAWSDPLRVPVTIRNEQMFLLADGTISLAPAPAGD